MAVEPEVVALATYGSTIRPRTNSSHSRATNTGRKSSNAPLLEVHPRHYSRRSNMTVLGVSVLLFASAFVLVNLVRVPIYDVSLKDSISVFEAPSTGTATPMQIHVALAGEVTVKTYSAIRSSIAAESETRLGMTISWATDVKTATSSVRYGLSKNDLSVVQQSKEPCEQYDFCAYTSPWMHHVTIPGNLLEPATTYYCTW